MSNASIVRQVLQVIAAYEREEIGAAAIADSIDLYEPALEGISRELRDRLSNLSLEVIRQDVTPFEQELLGWASSNSALTELKLVLSEIASRDASG